MRLPTASCSNERMALGAEALETLVDRSHPRGE